MLRMGLLALALMVSLPATGYAAGPAAVVKVGEPLNIGFVLYMLSDTLAR